MSKDAIAAAVVVPLIALALLALVILSGRQWRRSARDRRRLLANAKPPGVGPATTLLITGEVRFAACGCIDAFIGALEAAIGRQSGFRLPYDEQNEQ